MKKLMRWALRFIEACTGRTRKVAGWVAEFGRRHFPSLIHDGAPSGYSDIRLSTRHIPYLLLLENRRAPSSLAAQGLALAAPLSLAELHNAGRPAPGVATLERLERSARDTIKIDPLPEALVKATQAPHATPEPAGSDGAAVAWSANNADGLFAGLHDQALADPLLGSVFANPLGEWRGHAPRFAPSPEPAKPGPDGSGGGSGGGGKDGAADSPFVPVTVHHGVDPSLFQSALLGLGGQPSASTTSAGNVNPSSSTTNAASTNDLLAGKKGIDSLFSSPVSGTLNPIVFKQATAQGVPVLQTDARGFSLQLSAAGATFIPDHLVPGMAASAVHLQFDGAAPVVPIATNPVAGGFGQVDYSDLYPGIGLQFYGNANQSLEYDWTVASGADASQIHMDFEGATGVTLDQNGNLLIVAPSGGFIQYAPQLYQTIDNSRVAVAGSFVLEGGNRVGFSVGSYDHTKTLIIDPITEMTPPNFAGPASFGSGNTPDSIASLTLDDGEKLLLVANFSDNDIAVLRDGGNGAFTPLTTLSSGQGPNGFAVGDFGNRHQDFAVANYSDGTISVFMGDGTGNFTARPSPSTGSGPANEMAVGDFSGDGKLDLAVANQSDGTVSVLLGTGNGYFASATNYTAGSGSDAVVAGNFFGNGRLDLAVANTNDGTISFLANDGTGAFAAPVNVTVGSASFYYYLGAGDFNSDGLTDVALTDYSTSTVHLLMNQGSGSFSQSDISVGSGPDGVAVGDVNADGALDLVVSNYLTNDVTELLGNGDGTFQSGLSFSAAPGAGPNGIVLDDFNADIGLDIAVANQNTGGASVLLNTAILGTAGQPLPNGVLARFTDVGGPANASAYTATIDWGDGSGTDVGTVVYLGSDQYEVRRPGHVYAAADSYDGQVSVDYTTPSGAVDVPFTAHIRPANSGIATDTTLSVTPSSGPGQPIVLSASVMPHGVGDGIPTGTVQFVSGQTVLGTATLVDGTATLNVGVASLPVGDKVIVAYYLGSAVYNASRSLTDEPVAVPSMPAPSTWVDDDWVGLANGTTVYFPGDANPHTIGTDAFATIQDGADHTSADGTEAVAAGTYVEQVSIHQSLHLVGADQSNTFIVAPGTLDDYGPTGQSNIVTIDGGDTTHVDVSRFTIQGPGAPAFGNLLVYGIFVGGGADADLHNLHITQLRDEPLSGRQNGVGIRIGAHFADQTGTGMIQNVTIDDYQKGGVVIDNAGTSATVTDASILGQGATSLIAANGVQISRGGTGTVTNNKITDNYYTGADTGTGILFFESNVEDSVVSGNDFSGDQHDIIDSTTAVALTAAQNPVTDAVTITATLGRKTPTNPPAPTPLPGTIQFYIDDVATGSPQSLDANNQASITVPSLSPGNHSVRADYSGSDLLEMNPSSNTITVFDVTGTTFDEVAAVPFTATVADILANPDNPSGNYSASINWGDSSSSSGGSLTPDGSGGFNVTGSHTYAAIGSYPVTVTVTDLTTGVVRVAHSTATVKTASTTVLTSSMNPSQDGQSVTFTATVTGASGTPTGTVTFYDGSASLGSSSLISGVATLSTSALSQGNHVIQAVYNGDSTYGTSSDSLLQQVTATSPWPISHSGPITSPGGVNFNLGGSSIAPNNGAVNINVPIYSGRSSGICLYCLLNSFTGMLTPLALVYNSNTVDVHPIIGGTLTSDPNDPVPTSIQAQVTWAGHTYSPFSVSTSGGTVGGSYSFAFQVPDEVTTSGNYDWSIDISVTLPDTTVINRTTSGTQAVAVQTNSGFGAGWSLAGANSLTISSAGIGYVDATTGETKFFTFNGSGYDSPANDQGTLTISGSDYVYRDKYGVASTFNSTGQILSVMAPQGVGRTFTYSGGDLVSVTDPDGGVMTITRDSGMVHTVELPGARTMTVTYSGTDVASITDEAGDVHAFTFDGDHRISNMEVGQTNTTFAFASDGTVRTIDRGSGAVTTVHASASRMLDGPIYNRNDVGATLQDPNGNTPFYGLDELGRMTRMVAADGSTQTWDLNEAGNPTESIDALLHRTRYQYNAAQDLTRITADDGTITTMTYDPTFNKPTSTTDPRGNTTTYVYDGTSSDLLSATDALGNTTTFTWSAGLKRTATDALGRVTTYTWDDPTRRLNSSTDALGNITTYTYDAVGNVIATQDALGHITTSAYDGKRRLLTQTDALGDVQTYTYSATDQMTSVTDQLGRTTSYVYDSLDRQTTVIDAAGTGLERRTTTAYDAASNVLSVTNPLGQVTSYGYDAKNRMVTEIDAFGTGDARTMTMAYDSNDNLLSTINARGVVTSFGYDTLNRQTERIDAWGAAETRTRTTVYDDAGDVVAKVDGLGHSTTFFYDSLNRQIAVQDALGNRTTTVYDEEGRTRATIDALGRRTTYSYDAIDRKVQTQDALGDLSTMIYDAMNLTASVDALGRRTSYAYDALNRQIEVEDALGNRSTSVYDAVGNMTASVDALGRRTTYSYDDLNRQFQVQDALGNLLTTVYDAGDNVTSSIDALGRRTTFSYDNLNRLTQTQDALANLSTSVYDANGNVTASIDALGRRTTYVYDALDRQIATTDALNQTTSTTYNAVNSVATTIDALGFVTTVAYDKLNRQVMVTTPSGGISTATYDAVGNVTSTINPAGEVTTIAYDALNRQTVVTDPRRFATIYFFDAVGNRVNLVDSDDNVSTFTFDALNRQVTETDPLGKTLTYTFDALGRQTSKTDRDGRLMTYSYDALDRQTGETWKDSGSSVLDTFTMTYDAIGNELTASKDGATITMTYDALDRVATRQDLNTLQTFTYDAVGNRTKVQDSFGGTTTSVYNAVNLLTTRQLDDGTNTLREDFTYTARDQMATASRYADLTGTTLVGITSYAYDAHSRLSHLQFFDGSSTSLAEYTYTYDLADRITSENLNGTLTTYTYDAASQLTNDSTTAYSYDANGNRTMPGYVTGADNRLLASPGATYTYDNEGNVTGKTDSTGTWAYTYDNQNQLVGATQTSATALLLTQATYVYDALGELASKSVYTQASGLTTVTKFAADVSGQTWADLTSGGSLTTRYVLGDNADERLARVDTGVEWLLTDRLGSVRNVTNGSGALTATSTYDGYGNGTTSGALGEYGFTGQRSFSELGLRKGDLSARWYNPTTGNWMEEDPIRWGGSDTNLVRYVANDPTNAIDTSGLKVSFDSITIDTDGKGIGEMFPHLGWIIDTDAFTFGFNVTIKATVTPGDDIKNAKKIHQDIFVLSLYKEKGIWRNQVADEAHGRIPKEIDDETADKLIEDWKKDKVTFAPNDEDMAWLCDPKNTSAKVEKEQITYTDAPGWGGQIVPPGFKSKRAKLPAKNKTNVSLRIWVKIFAPGTDGGKDKDASFWVSGAAVNKDDKWVKDWMSGPNPKLPKTW